MNVKENVGRSVYVSLMGDAVYKEVLVEYERCVIIAEQLGLAELVKMVTNHCFEKKNLKTNTI